MASFTLDGETYEYLKPDPGHLPEEAKSWEYGNYPKVLATLPLANGQGVALKTDLELLFFPIEFHLMRDTGGRGVGNDCNTISKPLDFTWEFAPSQTRHPSW